MKKVLIMAIAIFSFHANAQLNKSFGAKAGLNIAQLNLEVGNESDSTDNLIAFHLGFYGEFKLANKFTIQPEVLYSRVGGEINEDGESGTFKLDYISIPIMFKYYPTEKFSLEAGPQISFLASSNLTSGPISIDAKDLFESMDFGFGVGANYHFTDKIFVNARYNLGLSNIVSNLYKNAIADELDINPNSVSMKNAFFQIGMGIKF